MGLALYNASPLHTCLPIQFPHLLRALHSTSVFPVQSCPLKRLFVLCEISSFQFLWAQRCNYFQLPGTVVTLLWPDSTRTKAHKLKWPKEEKKGQVHSFPSASHLLIPITAGDNTNILTHTHTQSCIGCLSCSANVTLQSSLVWGMLLWKSLAIGDFPITLMWPVLSAKLYKNT